MAEGLNASYREILQNEISAFRPRELPVNTGGLVDDRNESYHSKNGGGYAYKSSTSVDSPCRNRFIYWKVSGDVLDLREVSLDFNLKSNTLRLRFQNSAVHHVSIHESKSHAVVLVSTSCSIHRFLFPHPDRLLQRDQYSDASLASIFSHPPRMDDPAHTHLLEVPSKVHTACSSLNMDDTAVYALALSSGVIHVIHMPPINSKRTVSVVELKHSSVMQRLWTGLVPQLIRGSDGGDLSHTLMVHSLGPDTLLFSVGNDLKLRMWSCSTAECLGAKDLIDLIPNGTSLQKTGSPDASKFILRKCVNSTTNSMTLGLYVNIADQHQFFFFSVSYHNLTHTSTLFTPQEDLIDYSLCDHTVWTLSTSPQGEIIARQAHIARLANGADNWNTIFLEPPLPLQVNVPDHMDARQCHMQAIFTPGQFATQAILKAINIFRRALDTTHIPDSAVPLEALKSEVAAVVEYEIQRSASEYEMSHEEFMALQSQQWSKFYSCLVQYQHRGQLPLGMLVDGNSGLVALVRKESLSFIRPSQVTEHMSLAPSDTQLAEHLHSASTNDEALCEDIAKMSTSLAMLHEALPAFSIFCFEQDLFHLQDPVEIAHTVITELLADPNELDQLWNDCLGPLNLIQDFPRAIEALIDLLDLAKNSFADTEADVSSLLTVKNLFSSQQGVHVICEAVTQFLRSRLQVTEDLLFTLTLIVHLGTQVGLPVSVVESIQSDLLPRVSSLVQSYFMLNWLCHTQSSSVSAAQKETSLRQQEVLGICAKGLKIPLHYSGDQNTSLLELFMTSYGGLLVREQLHHWELSSAVWKEGVVPTVLAVCQQLWPFTSFILPEFLLAHCQFTALQEYVRLCQWCPSNGGSRKFLLGIAYLNSNEPSKAFDCFIAATQGAGTESFLQEVAQPGSSDGEIANTNVLYYLKVISLIEIFEQPMLVIDLAKTAISIAEPDDPNMATLWSIIFKHELILGHNQAAYSAMLSNPDSSRRKDCLREFLVVLCERSELKTLVELPYRDRHVVLEEEVVDILESRARSIDLNQHQYYPLLYSFHVFRSNYRKAGSIMYEYGMRLGRECPGLKGFQRQAKAYLAALNALRLVEEKNAWIVKPLSVPSQSDPSEGIKDSLSGKMIPPPIKRSIEVLELSHIEKEYILVHARLQLLQVNPNPTHMSGPTVSADETLSLLVNAGLMDSAVNICKMFDLSMTPVFEGLASRCVHLAENSESFMQSDNDYTSDAWSWLKRNHLPASNAARDAGSSDHAWRMLQSYLSKYGSDNSSYHRCVLACLLAQGFPPPDWLMASYKKVNYAELLHLLLDYDLLQEAVELVLELIEAVSGKGKEYFGLKNFLHSGSTAVWLPYTAIDQLLIALGDVKTEPHFTELRDTLKEGLEKYFGLVEDISQQSLRASFSTLSWNQRNI